MGSEVNGEKKYILVMSDRTSDRKMNQALSEAVHAAETANRGERVFFFPICLMISGHNECDYWIYNIGCK